MSALSSLEPRAAEASTKEPAITFARRAEAHDRCHCADTYTDVGTFV